METNITGALMRRPVARSTINPYSIELIVDKKHLRRMTSLPPAVRSWIDRLPRTEKEDFLETGRVHLDRTDIVFMRHLHKAFPGLRIAFREENISPMIVRMASGIRRSTRLLKGSGIQLPWRDRCTGCVTLPIQDDIEIRLIYPRSVMRLTNIESIKDHERRLFQLFHVFFRRYPDVRYNEVGYASELTFDRLFVPPSSFILSLYRDLIRLLPINYGLAIIYHLHHTCTISKHNEKI